MPTITQLSPQVKNPQRYNLFIDDAFFCGVDEKTIFDFNLKVDVDITQAQLDKIYHASELAKLYDRALDYLSRRPRSQREMEQYLFKKLRKYNLDLATKEREQEVVDTLIQRLIAANYINDEDFAKWWIEQRTERRAPLGYQRIRSELFQKGVSGPTIESVWEAMNVDESDLMQKQFEKLQQKYNIEDPKDKQRLVQNLQRKGFRWDQIKSVLK